MTISNTTRSVVHTGNGLTTAWPFSFYVPNEDSLIVKLYEIATGDYTTLDDSVYNVTGIDDDAGGTVTYPISGTPLSNGFQLIIERSVPLVQGTSINTQTGFLPDVVERQLDLIVMMIQGVREELDRSWKAQPGQTIDDFEVGAEGTLPIWGADGRLLEGPTGGDIESAQTYAAQTAADLVTAQGILADIIQLQIEIGEAAGEGLGDMLSGQNLADLSDKQAGFDNLHLKGADIAAAATLDLSASTGWYVVVTGNTGITAMTLPSGDVRFLRFTGTPLLTHAANMILNANGGNIQIGAGDRALVVGDAAGVVYVTVFSITGRGLVNPANMASLASEDQALTGGAAVTSKSLGTITTGTVTVDVADRPDQHYTNNGAHTLDVAANTGTCIVEITNGASAGAINVSAFDKVDGSFTTTNAHVFLCTVKKSQNKKYLAIKALQ